jgi:hypothetical protein
MCDSARVIERAVFHSNTKEVVLMPKEFTDEARESQPKLLPDSTHAFADVQDDGNQSEVAHRVHMARLAESLKVYGILPQLALEDHRRDEKHMLQGRVAEQEVDACRKDDEPQESKPTVYEVKKGDTVWGISRDYLRRSNSENPSEQAVKAMALSIAKENRLANPDRIQPGLKLKLPEVCAPTITKADAPAMKPQTAEKEPGVKPEDEKPAQVDTKPEPPEEEKTADSGLDFVRYQFDKIDKDSDHHVTRREIDHYVRDNKDLLSEKQVSALEKVGERESTLQKQSNDENSRENWGITRQDIDVAERRMHAIEYAQAHFESMDGNGNGHVSKFEIRGYVRANDARLSKEERADCQLLMDQCGDLDDKCNDEMFFECGGFSKKDLEAAQNELGAKTLSGEDKLPLPKEPDNAPEEGFDPVTMQDFSKESLRLFDKVDSDADNSLSARELRAAVQSDNYKGKDRQAVAALYRSRSDIAEMKDDDFLVPDSNVRRGDLEQMEVKRIESIAQSKNIKTARDYLARDNNFLRLDTDADDYLSKEEVSTALQSNWLNAEQRTSLTFLRDHLDKVSDASNDERGPEFRGITQMDLDAFGNTEFATIEQNLLNAYQMQKQALK